MTMLSDEKIKEALNKQMMHKEDILREAKYYEHYLNKLSVYLKGQTTLTRGPFLIEEIKIEWLDIPKTSYDMRYILRHKYDSKCTISVREGDIVLYLDDGTEKRGVFNKMPKYSVNDIVIINNGISDAYHVVGVIKGVYNHRDTGDVFYHIIFTSNGPRKIFEREIETKFNTDKFWRGRTIYKQILAKMYHAHPYDYLSEKEFVAWVYANFEVVKEEKQSTMHFPNYKFNYKYLERSLDPSRCYCNTNVANLTSVDSSLKALDEFNRREFERIAAEPIRFEVDKMKMEEIKMMLNNKYGVSKFECKKVIFSGPCTIILWKDGSKTIAKASDKDAFDPEKGVAICFMKKLLGHTETNKILRKASKDYYDEIARVANKQLDEELKKSVKTTEEYFGTNRVVMKPWDFGEPMDNNKVIKVAKEKEDDNLAVGSRCSTCEHFDKPMTKDPCCHCLSGDQYKKREEKGDDN